MFDTLPIAFAVFLSILYHIQPVPADVGPGGRVYLPELAGVSDTHALKGGE